MRRLVWDTSFRRAFRRVTRRSPELGERIFALEPDPAGGEDAVVLADIGTHDEVY